MKPLFEDIGKKRGQHTLIAFEIEQQKLDFFWHYHPEYELTFILKGRGTRMVGDHHEYFETGDLVLIGPGLPHTWVSDSNSKEKCKAIVIQFSIAFMQRLLGLEEVSSINKLLNNSKLGLSFNAGNTHEIKKLIIELPAKHGMGKMTHFLLILDALSKLKSNALASSYYQPLKGVENEKRINTVCQYIQKHSTETLTIHTAASLIHLTPSAFCKFFKRITGKTFSDYVNDIRIANVCKDLLATDKQVAEIAYENGFETLTYFNRVFLKKKGIKPSNYRKSEP
jgi:YesN/AraC family two-component response regulator